MPSQLYNNDKITFIAARNFTYGAILYRIGEDFPQEKANNIETLVRARFVIPVVDKMEDKPRHWHRHIRPRAEVLERLNRVWVQLRMPHEPGAVPEAEEFDPSEHTVPDVQAYMAEHPEDTDRVMQAERDGKARKGLLEA